MQDVALAVFGVAALLGLVSLLLPLANRLSVPFTVVLAVVGIGLGLLISTDLTLAGPAGDFMNSIGGFRLSSDAFIYLFLPALLFHAGLTVDVRRLMDDAWPVFLLAIVAVVVCTGVVGLGLDQIADVGLLACLLLGAIVATTDSAAVVAIFRDIGAPKRLTIIVEGESLLNDAAAIAIFAVILAVITTNQEATVAGALWSFLKGLTGGLLVGFIAARLFIYIIGLLRDVVVAEITLTFALAYLVFIVSENYFGVSGVIAVVTAAMVVNSEGKTRISPGAWGNLVQTWKQLDFWATSLIFMFAAMLAPEAIKVFQSSDLMILVALFFGTILARVVVLYLFMPAFSFFGVARPISNNYNAVLIWGGLRGAVTVALALSVYENMAVPEEIRRFIFVMAMGYVLTTLILQAPTLKPLIKFLKLDQLSDSEKVVRDRVMSLSRQRIRTRVKGIAEGMGLDSVYASVSVANAEASGDKDGQETLDSKDGLRVGLLTLANREGELYLDYFQHGLLDRHIADLLRAENGRLLDRTKTRGAEGYLAASLRSYAISRRFRRALWIHRKLKIRGPLESAVADRFETLLVIGFALKDLREVNRELITPLLGENVATPLDRVLEDREAATQSALEALELQYPAYADSLRARYLERMVLGFEDNEYKSQYDQSMISSEVYDDLELDLRTRQRALDKRPALDLGLRLQRMIRKVDFFRELNDKGTRDLVRELNPELAVPGERIISQGERGDSMYFIASGEVDVVLPEITIELKQGNVFGEMALVTNEPRNADVTAKGYVTLLVLKRRDFMDLTRTIPALRQQIEKIAQERQQTNKSAAE